MPQQTFSDTRLDRFMNAAIWVVFGAALVHVFIPGIIMIARQAVK